MIVQFSASRLPYPSWEMWLGPSSVLLIAHLPSFLQLLNMVNSIADPSSGLLSC